MALFSRYPPPRTLARDEICAGPERLPESLKSGEASSPFEGLRWTNWAPFVNPNDGAMLRVHHRPSINAHSVSGYGFPGKPLQKSLASSENQSAVRARRLLELEQTKLVVHRGGSRSVLKL